MTASVKFCKMCGTQVTRFVKYKKEWWDWCSNKCMGSDPVTLEKKKKTNITLFGADHPMHSEIYRSKLKDTFMKNYGVDNPSKAPVVQQKMKETFMRNYGVDNPSKNLDVIEKIRESALNRYAIDELYDDQMRKRKTTCVEKYGTEWSSQSHIDPTNIEKLHDLAWISNQHFVLKKSCQQIADELGISATPVLNMFSQNNLVVDRFCTSSGENEVRNFLGNLSINVVSNDRFVIFPREIDILLPDQKIGIEYNGDFWHSELQGKNKQYHLSKTNECEEKGIHLIHIMENEWLNKQEIVKSRLLHLLGRSKRIFARKCSISIINKKEANIFFDLNHIQGKCSSKVNIGLFYDNNLVAVGAFAKSRYSKKAEWELIRYCSTLYTSVIGGCSKIFKNFVKLYDPTSIVSYADRRWSTGKLYNEIGFTFSHNSEPNYFYFLSAGKLQSRILFQKHKLKEKLEKFDASLTEWENMKNNKYDRIWDCGNKVYIWKK